MSRPYAFSGWRIPAGLLATSVVLFALGYALTTTDRPCGDTDCTEDHR